MHACLHPCMVFNRVGKRSGMLFLPFPRENWELKFPESLENFPELWKISRKLNTETYVFMYTVCKFTKNV